MVIGLVRVQHRRPWELPSVRVLHITASPAVPLRPDGSTAAGLARRPRLGRVHSGRGLAQAGARPRAHGQCYNVSHIR